MGIGGNRTRAGGDESVGIGVAFQAKQLGTHFRSVLVAKLAILFEGSVDDVFEFRRHLGIYLTLVIIGCPFGRSLSNVLNVLQRGALL